MIKPATGQSIAKWRQKRGINVEQAAAMIGVQCSSWWRWENGGKIQFPLLLALALKALEGLK